MFIMQKDNYYKLDKELVNCGWKYDETGVYIPYLFENNDNPVFIKKMYG